MLIGRQEARTGISESSVQKILSYPDGWEEKKYLVCNLTLGRVLCFPYPPSRKLEQCFMGQDYKR